MKKIMKIKRPHIATIDEVIINRDGEIAIIEYKKPGIATVYLTIGKEIHQMTEEDILNCHNDCIHAQLESVRNYKYIATEIPPGKPQVEYSEGACYWTPRGNVLRCQVGFDSDNHEVAVLIDDQEFSLKEFGKMLSTYEGWGMRVIFVPEDETYKSPPIEIKDPNEDKMASLMLLDELCGACDH